MYNKKTWESNEIITKDALNNIENGIDALYNENIIKEFNCVEDLKSTDVVVGDLVRTLGYYTAADGGGYVYEIVDDTTLETEVLNIKLNNGLIAKYGFNMKFYDVNVLTMGVKRGISTEDVIYKNALLIEKFIELYNKKSKLYFPGGETYYINNIHFTNFTKKDTKPEIFMYGDIGIANGEKMSRIDTRHSDFICDKRGVDPDNPIITGLKLTLEHLFILSDTYIDDDIPKGICFGQDINTPKNGQEVNFLFNDVNITGFDYGVYSPHWACGGSGGERLGFSNCHCGIYVGQSIHCFSANYISFENCVIGMDTGWGGQFARLENVHIATGYLGPDRTEFEEYIGILTRGGVTIDSIYYEPYTDNGYMDRCVLIKHEGYAYGIGPLYIKHTSIAYPGSGNVGLFMKSDCYLGFGPSRVPDHSGATIEPWDEGHYPNGAVIFENCNLPKYISSLKKVISINSTKTQNNTRGYQFNNVWWGYDFDGLEYQSPELLIGLRKSMRYKGKIQQLELSTSSFKVIRLTYLSEYEKLYNPDYFSQNFLLNNLDQFHVHNHYGFTNVYDINIDINGTISSTADVTIGIFARVKFDNSTARCIKKIKVIRPNEVYNDFSRHIVFELNPIVDLITDETQIILGYISNTNETTNLLTAGDRDIIEIDATITRKKIPGYNDDEKLIYGNVREEEPGDEVGE